MIVSGSILERVSKIYELYFKNSTKPQGSRSDGVEMKRKDEANFSMEGKRKLLLEEIVLESLDELSTNTFESGSE